MISDGDLSRIDALWDSAVAACEPGSLEQRHVRAAQMSWRFYKKMSGRGEWADTSAHESLEKAFNHDCNELGITRLNEGAGIPWVEP